MTGAQFGTFVLGLIVVAIVVAIAVWLLHWLYLRSSKERAFVRTGLGGQKVVLDGGAFVLPIVHDVIPVNMNTLRLEVARGRDKALITKDRMRADIAKMLHMDAGDVQDDDNLPDLGLDSLRLMKLVLAWEEAGLKADFGLFAEHGTLGEWWQAIEAQQAG